MKMVNRDFIMFDVGANDGSSIQAELSEQLQQRPADPIIHAFEPTPRLVDILKKSLLNPLSFMCIRWP